MNSAEKIQGETMQVPARPANPVALIERLLASGASMETIEKAMALQERWEASQARKAFDNALADAAAKLPILRKNKRVRFKSDKAPGGYVDYKHEDLAEVVGTVAPILSEFGLKHRWRIANKPGDPVIVTCIISHRGGHTEENTLSAAPDDSGGKNPIQRVKSTVTYLERITLLASLGLASAEDDDGRVAGSGAEAEPIQTITQAQADELRDILEANGKPRDVYLKWAGVEHMEDIPAAQYEACLYAARFKKEESKK